MITAHLPSGYVFARHLPWRTGGVMALALPLLAWLGKLRLGAAFLGRFCCGGGGRWQCSLDMRIYYAHDTAKEALL